MKQFFIFFFIFLLCFSFSMCSFFPTNIDPIDISKIDSVVVVENPANNKTSLGKVKLNILQIKNLVEKINAAKEIGLTKYIPKYSIKIFMNDKTVRNLRATDHYIKEKNDCTSDLGDTTFLKSLFTF